MKTNTTAPHLASLNTIGERLTVTTRKVACDGPEFSKHPRVYLTIGTEGEIFCPYCSRHFILAANAQDEAH